MAKGRIIWLVLLWISIGFGSTNASHIYGGQMTYSCLNACTTRIYLKAYRDCTGAAVISTGNIGWVGAPGCTPPPAVSNWSMQVTTEITLTCPGAITRCTNPGAAINGYQEYSWHRDYDICSGTPCVYDLSWGDCCRNASISSLANAGSAGIYIANTTINTLLTPCNNSPQFLSPPVMYLAQGTSTYISAGASDPDGDSLVFSLGTCWHSPTVPVTYLPGYSGTMPFGQSWTLSINPETGLIYCDATPGNLITGVICVNVTEFRNGAEIGRVMRDFQLTVIPNPNGNFMPVLGSPTNVSPNAQVIQDEIFLCSPGTVCFDIETSDLNSSQNLLLAWSGNLPGASFTMVGNSNVADTIPGTALVPPAGHFCWTAPANGHYRVAFGVFDNQCPVVGSAERVIVIHVGQGPAQASATLGTCPTANFSASGCGTGPFSYDWSGAGGFSSTAQNPSFAYPGPGTYPWQVVVSNGWLIDTIRDTLVIDATPDYQSFLSGVHFVAPCSGNLYDTIDAGLANSYLWSNGETTREIVAFLGGNYGVTIEAANGCYYHDSTELFWASPDVYGVVETSTGAPLQNQRILLVQHDTLNQALWAVDSAWTDSLGYYFFCNGTPSMIFLKATPNALDYPQQMPTYADTTLFWNSAIPFYPVPFVPLEHNFSTLFGINPGGPGFIGGLITQGANKMNAVGDPVPGLRVFLRDANTDAILGHRVTNMNGYFSFAGIPLGDYEIVPDKPNVSTTNVPALALTAQTQVLDSLDFQLHSTWLELVLHPNGVAPQPMPMEISVAPNPFDGSTWLELQLQEPMKLNVTVFDLFGQSLGQLISGEIPAGVHRFSIGEGLPNGVYFLQCDFGLARRSIRILKVE
ncbi:MAG: hypothetical protein IPN95_06005 [Bacteroidetes bacterium]|nr:hypothetical protein [Bacteroidota bacterium]